MNLRAQIHELEARSLNLDQSAGVIRFLLDAEILDAVRIVEDLLTDGLRAVFHDQNISVKAEIEESRGKVSVNLVTRHTQPDGTVVEGLATEGFGGAIATVQSVLLRVVLILQRNMRHILIMDEPFGAMDENYIQGVLKFLSALSRKLNMDMLIVAHPPIIVEAADKAYRIHRKDGEPATFKEITK